MICTLTSNSGSRTPTPNSGTSAVVFAYHNVGVRCLSVLLAHGVDVALVVTHRDSPNETIWFDSVATLAELHSIPVITPDDPNEPEIVARIAALHPDFLFSFYYRLMLKAPLLATAQRGAYNMHGSLLPKYRGRVPVNWAIIHGERETGATLHRMLENPDAGEIIAQQAVPILPDDTAFVVFNKVTVAAEMAFDRVLPQLIDGSAPHLPQDLSKGGYFGGRKAEDGRIDWRQPARSIHNLVRAVAPPYPGAFCKVKPGSVYDKIASCATLRVLKTLPTDRSPRSPQPGLYAADGQIFADCGPDGDTQVLRLLALELDGVALDVKEFLKRFGPEKILLS